jgi:riboflavin synthase
MKITFIGYKESSVNIFEELGKALRTKISGLEITERFSPFIEDLPKLAQEAAEDSDFIFVFALTGEKQNIPFIEEKLIDVELKTKTRILKVIRQDEMSSEEAEFLEEKDNLIDEFTDLIINILFNEKGFSPKDPDFGL